MTPDDKIKATLGDLIVRLAITESERDAANAKLDAANAESAKLRTLLKELEERDRQQRAEAEPAPLLGDNLHP